MKIPKEWNILPLKANDKFPIIKGWESTKYPREKIKNHRGNFGIGTGIISGGLIVFDWDFRHGFNRKEDGIKVIYKEFKEKLPKLAETLIVDTPHGYHFYYILKNEELGNTSLKNVQYDKKKFISQNSTRFGQWLKGVDTRANGGQVVCPPSEVDGKKYSWKKEIKPIEITMEEYESIFKFFELPNNEKAENTVRQGFVDILEGKINPNETNYKANEHVIWKELYHECAKVGLLPEDLFEGLQKFQKGFDLDKTKVQLKNQKNHDYIFNGKRLSKKKYEQYFNITTQSTTTSYVKQIKSSNSMYLEGSGFIHSKDEGLFLEKPYKNDSETFRVLEGKLELEKLSYETMNNNKIILTGSHEGKHFRTYPLTDLLDYLKDYIYYGSKGKDAVKFYIHKVKENLPTYDLSYVLGFNSHWCLPQIEEQEKLQILTSTDKQKEAYYNAMEMIVEYTDEEKTKIKKMFHKWLDITMMDPTKLSIIIGWCIAAPFRYVFINKFSLFPVLCLYGNKSTGKSSVLEFFTVYFYNLYKSYNATSILFSTARFEDILSMSSFPVFIQEVEIVPKDVLSLIKEHATGVSRYFRKKNARENDFDCLKSAAIGLDCNKLPYTLRDPAMNTKLTLIQFTDEETIELNPEWNTLKNKLRKKKLFSLMYDYTKSWTEEDVEKRIDIYLNEIIVAIEKKNRKDIEKDNPRIIQQYVIIAYGIDLFNEVFDTTFNRKNVLKLLLSSRTVMTQTLLNDFYAFCNEAKEYHKMTGKSPNYLSHQLKIYNSRNKGNGFMFTSLNKSDFQHFIQEKFTLEELVEQLRDALSDKEKYCITHHNTGKLRGIFIHNDFFEVVEGKKKLELKEVVEEYGEPPN